MNASVEASQHAYWNGVSRWIKRYNMFQDRHHPSDIGKRQMEAFLTSFAAARVPPNNKKGALPRPFLSLTCPALVNSPAYTAPKTA